MKFTIQTDDKCKQFKHDNIIVKHYLFVLFYYFFK
jgi:hypothetical protein